jgi:hypothetical protein
MDKPFTSAPTHVTVHLPAPLKAADASAPPLPEPKPVIAYRTPKQVRRSVQMSAPTCMVGCHGT